MGRKEGLIGCLLLISLLSVSLVSAGTFEDAKNCLQNEIDTKDSLSLGEAVFGMLALGDTEKLMDAIDDAGDKYCWPKSGCKLKETGQVLLSLEENGKNTGNIIDWIKNQKQISEDLIWYLQIDITSLEESECKIKYGTTEKTISIDSDMRLSGDGGSCLNIGAGGYWLMIDNSCLDKEFEISCDKDFITNLVYRKQQGGTVYVSDDTHSASSLGTTKERLSSRCLGTGSSCDYEGTLWGVLSLQNSGEDVKEYIPYLVALADENKEFFPSSFLYVILTTEGWDSNEYFTKIIQNQKNNQFWKIIGTPGGMYYDTALALMALGSTGVQEYRDAEEYLLSIQTEEGCWDNNNIKSTGFLIWASGRGVSSSGEGQIIYGDSCEDSSDCKDNYECIDNFCIYTSSEKSDCENEGYYCVVGKSVCEDSEGEVFSDYDCQSFNKVCCSVDAKLSSCTELGGFICPTEEVCQGFSKLSSDGTCCVEGECVEDKNLYEGEKNGDHCLSFYGGECRTTCNSDEDKKESDCPEGKVCCVGSSSFSLTKKCSSDDDCKEGEKCNDDGKCVKKINWWLIGGIMILIIIVLLGIVFRNKLRFLFHSKKKPKPIGAGAFGGMKRPGPPSFGAPARRPSPRRRLIRRAVGGEDKEMNSVMGKLREMSK